uniref:Uncharacterized protein n=1 Tax=Ditylenchus dipsaci TaxID=166011 RepID=A0A915DV29_9BILA
MDLAEVVIAKNAALERAPLAMLGVTSNRHISMDSQNFTVTIEKSLISTTLSSFDYFGDFATLLTTLYN